MGSLLVRCSDEELKDLTVRAKALDKSRARLIRELLWPESQADITPLPDITPADITEVPFEKIAALRPEIKKASDVAAPERCACGETHKRCPKCGRVHQKPQATRCQRCTMRLV